MKRKLIIGGTTAAVIVSLMIRGIKPEFVAIPDVIPDWVVEETRRRRNDVR